jgi:hypothetical protein
LATGIPSPYTRPERAPGISIAVCGAFGAPGRNGADAL